MREKPGSSELCDDDEFDDGDLHKYVEFNDYEFNLDLNLDLNLDDRAYDNEFEYDDLHDLDLNLDLNDGSVHNDNGSPHDHDDATDRFVFRGQRHPIHESPNRHQ